MERAKKTKKELAFIFYTEKQIQSFLVSGLIEKLKNHYIITCIVTVKLSDNFSHFSDIRIIQIKSWPRILTLMTNIQQCAYLWRYKDRSMSFTVRAFNQFGTKSERNRWQSVILYEMENWNFLKRFSVRVLALNPWLLFLNLLLNLFRRILRNRLFNSIIKKNDFHLVLIPFGGHMSAEFTTLSWFFKTQVESKVVALQENWDNLSSKSFITNEIDGVLVWGEQSSSHVRFLHRKNHIDVHEVGAPKFDLYWSENTLKPIAISDVFGRRIDLSESDYLLVTGTGDGIDDFQLISMCYKILEEMKLENLILVYRPHPKTRTKHDLTKLLEAYPEIIIDEGIEAQFFNHHVPLVRNARVVINHFSTLSLESLISHTPVIIPLFLGKPAIYKYTRVINEFQHYIGLRLIRMLYTPQNPEELKESLQEILRLGEDEIEVCFKSLRLEWLCVKGPYFINVLGAIEKILQD